MPQGYPLSCRLPGSSHISELPRRVLLGNWASGYHGAALACSLLPVKKDLPKGFSAGVSLWGLRSLLVWPTRLAGKRLSPRKRRGREVLHVLVGLLANNSLSRPLLLCPSLQ